MQTNTGTGAQRLAVWLTKHKVTHEAMMERLHAAGLPAVTLPTIGRWLSEARTPRIGAILAIERVTKIPPSAWSPAMTSIVPRQLATRKVNARAVRNRAGRAVVP